MHTEASYGYRITGGIREAERCLQCYDAPCAKGCPAGVYVKRFIGLLQKGEYAAAAAVIEKDNPLGLICGYICPAADTCQRNCISGKLGRPIDIRALQAYAIIHGRENPEAYQAAKDAEQALRINRGGEVETRAYTAEGRGKVAVVGGGPAGLSAAWYLKKFGYQVTIYEASDRIGGRLTGGIPAFRLSEDMVQEELRRLTKGVEICTNAKLGRDFTVRKLLDSGCRGVILAAGKTLSKTLPLEGAALEGVYTADQILAGDRRQKRSCRNAVVIGGGDVAIDTARTLLRGGAGQVTICYRGGSLQVKASREEREKACQEGITLQLHAIPLAVVGEDGKITGVRFRRSELTENQEGGVSPAPLPEEYDFTVPADMAVFAVGCDMETEALTGSGVAVTKGCIVVENSAANLPGVYAAGDAIGGKTAVEAVGGGKAAACALHEYLRREEGL